MGNEEIPILPHVSAFTYCYHASQSRGIRALREYIAEALDATLDKGIKPNIYDKMFNDIVEDLKSSTELRLMWEALGLTDESLKQILEEEVFLAQHRKKYRSA